MPLAMKSAAKRFGIAAGAVFPVGMAEAVSAPKTGMDSSQGRAMTTPAPRNIVRREIRSRCDFIRSFITSSLCKTAPSALVQELRAGHDCLDHRGETIV